MTPEEIRNSIRRYVPAGALDTCAGWIAEHRFTLRITKSRNSKYGDYRPPKNGKGHVITVNHDLNPYAFLITFTHEVAHLTTFLKTKSLREPHGPRWKAEFRTLLKPLIDRPVFPPELVAAVTAYIQNPAATSCSDIGLLRALRRYDAHRGEWLLLEELAVNTRFRIRTGRVFIKKRLVRKNYLCIEASSRHEYTLNPLIEVQPVDGPAAALRNTG
jgi:SprT protein